MPERDEVLAGGARRGAIVHADERYARDARAAVDDERDVALAGEAQERVAVGERPDDEAGRDGVGEQRRRALLALRVERGDDLQHGVLPRGALREPAEELDGGGVLEDVGERFAEEQPDAARPAPAQAARGRVGAGVAELAL